MFCKMESLFCDLHGLELQSEPLMYTYPQRKSHCIVVVKVLNKIVMEMESHALFS